MTNREKFIEVFGDNPQRHHITKSWWDEEYIPPITIKPQESEDNDSENKEIKEILIMFIKHIKYSGVLYPFNFTEQDRLIEITNKWLNEEEK